MKHLTRLYYYHRNFASFTSINSISYATPRKVNILRDNLYHKTSPAATLCTQVQKPDINHPELNLESKHLPIPQLLDSFNSRLTELLDKSVDETVTDAEIQSALIECILHLGKFTNDQLLQFIDSLITIKSKSGVDFRKHSMVKHVIKHVDDECLRRSSKMDLDTVLPIMEKFSSLISVHQRNRFLKNLAAQYHSTLHKAPTDLLFRFVSIINKHEHWDVTSPNPYEFEYYLEHNFDQLDVTQITILINLLIQRNQPIVSFELKKTIFLYFVDNLEKDRLRDDHLYYFLDLFCSKESFFINMTSSSLTNEFLRMFDLFEEKFDQFSFKILAMVAFLSTKFLVHRPEYLEKLYRRLLIERDAVQHQKLAIDHTVYTSFFFNHRFNDEEQAYSNILEIITSDPLKSSYKNTKRYIRLISWFCSMGFYRDDLIDEILDESYLKKTYKRLNRFSMYPYPLLIDSSIDIEYAQYKGNRLSPKVREELLKCYSWDLLNYPLLMDCQTDPYQLTDDINQSKWKDAPDILYCDILKQIGSILNSLYDEEITYVGYVLPHMPRPNLLFCLDENNVPQKLDYFKATSSFVDWNGLDFNRKWHAVTVLVRNTSMKNSEAVPLGIEVTKIRQLQKINFDVVSVVQDEWINMSDEERSTFCSNLITQRDCC